MLGCVETPNFLGKYFDENVAAHVLPGEYILVLFDVSFITKILVKNHSTGG